MVILANVLFCWIVSAPDPPWFNEGHTRPPPANVLALELTILMVPVEELTVNPLLLVLAFQLVPVTVHVPLPSTNVFVPEPNANAPRLTLLLSALNVPLDSVTVLAEPTVKLSDSVQVPPTPLKTIGMSSVVPLLAIVLLPLVAPKVVVLVPVMVIVEDSVKLPHIVRVELTTEPANPVKFKSLTFAIVSA